MLELLKENVDKIIPFVQEKFGQLSEDEINDLKTNPSKIPLFVEEKFGVSREQVENTIRAHLGDDLVGGIADKANGLLGGLNK